MYKYTAKNIKHPIEWVVSVKTFKTKTGNIFGVVSDSANYIPMDNLSKDDQKVLKQAIAEEEITGDKIYFSVRPTKPTTIPVEDGYYKLTAEDCWIDKREGYADKHIIRCKNATFTKLAK